MSSNQIAATTDELATASSTQNVPTSPTTFTSPATSTSPADRIDYLDNLRALAMLLGVFLHAALAYAHPAQSIWLATDISSSTAVDVSIWFIHLFRMSLFFLLSGYFAKLVIERKGLRAFMWNRLLRIVVPLLVFYVPLVMAMTLVIIFALGYLEQPRGVMSIIAEAAKDQSAQRDGKGMNGIGTMHLWFLYYLVFFSGLGAAAYRWLPIRLEWLFERPLVAAFAPLILVPAVLAVSSPLPAPESFVPTWWPFVFYGAFFLAGWQLFGRESCLAWVDQNLWLILVGSLVLYVPYYLLLPNLDVNLIIELTDPRPWWKRVVTAVLTAYLSVSLTLASLSLGKRFLAKRSGWLRFTAESSYWIYLIHLPIVIFLQTLLVPIALSVWLKLTAVILGTLLFSLASYMVFVRYTPIGWMLHGKKKFP